MVILLDKHKKPLGFATERRVRKFFEKHRAVMYRMFPTVVILKDVDSRTIDNLPHYRIKIDPGAKYDGIAIIRDDTNEIVWAMQIEHRGYCVTKNLETRRNARRNRRSRETWYRRCKFADGGKFTQDGKKGKIPPSIHSVIGNTKTWVKRLMKWINITDASFEAVRFDTQLMDNPDIEGKQYQAGTLAGTEIREYLLDRYQHTCQYCGGESGDAVLEWEHIKPKSRGGSNSVKNATLACHKCNQAKGARTPSEWLEAIQKKPHHTKLDEARMIGIRNVMAHKTTGRSNRYCAWVNITRKKIEAFLFSIFDSVECASGGRTKYNRTALGYPNWNVALSIQRFKISLEKWLKDPYDMVDAMFGCDVDYYTNKVIQHYLHQRDTDITEVIVSVYKPVGESAIKDPERVDKVREQFEKINDEENLDLHFDRFFKRFPNYID